MTISSKLEAVARALVGPVLVGLVYCLGSCQLASGVAIEHQLTTRSVRVVDVDVHVLEIGLATAPTVLLRKPRTYIPTT